MQTDAELLLKMLREPDLTLTTHLSSRREDDYSPVTARAEMALDIPIQVAPEILANGRHQKEPLPIREFALAVHSGVATTLYRHEGWVIPLTQQVDRASLEDNAVQGTVDRTFDGVMERVGHRIRSLLTTL